VIRTQDDVWGIDVRFLPEARYLSLQEHVQTASMVPLKLLSKARATGIYFPVAKAAGAQN